jgi:hypothetical protein
VTKYSRNHLKGGKIYFGLWCQKVQSIMVGKAWWSRAAHVLVERKQREKPIGRG